MRPNAALPENTSPFVNWFWKYCWMTDNPAEVAHIWLETEAMSADPDTKEPHYFIDRVIPGENGDIFVHMEKPVLH